MPSIARTSAVAALTVLLATPALAAPAEAPPAASWNPLKTALSWLEEAFSALHAPPDPPGAKADTAAAEGDEEPEPDPAGYLGPGTVSTSECTEECGDSELGGVFQPGG